jgi:hypothetical protein
MSSILSFSVKPSQFNSGAAVTLKVGVNKQGTIIFYFEGNNPANFSNGTSRLEMAVSPIKNEFNTTISGINGLHNIYVQFTDESPNERKSYSLNIS